MFRSLLPDMCSCPPHHDYNPVQVEQSARHTPLEPTLFCHYVFTWFQHSELWDVSIFWGYQILTTLQKLKFSTFWCLLVSGICDYPLTSCPLVCRINRYPSLADVGRMAIVRCILLHGYGLRKRRTERKPCDYVTQYVLACNNAQKLIPCHIGVYCILHVLWPLAVDGKSVLSQTCHSFRNRTYCKPNFCRRCKSSWIVLHHAFQPGWRLEQCLACIFVPVNIVVNQHVT